MSPVNHETPSKGACENPGGDRVQNNRTVIAFLNGQIAAHQLPALAHDLWRDGFFCGQQRAQARIDRANREADYWYYVANNPAEVRAEHLRTLKHFDVVQARKAVRA